MVKRPDSLADSMATVMGALARNIMEGATPMVNSLIMANVQEVCISNDIIIIVECITIFKYYTLK